MYRGNSSNRTLRSVLYHCAIQATQPCSLSRNPRSTALAISNSDEIDVFLVLCSTSPKHQSGTNFACPAIKKLYVARSSLSKAGAPVQREYHIDQGVVFILHPAVMDVNLRKCFTKSVPLKVVDVRYRAACTFPRKYTFID